MAQNTSRHFQNFILPAAYRVEAFFFGKDGSGQPAAGSLEEDAAYLNGCAQLDASLRTGTYFFRQVHADHCEHISRRTTGNVQYATADAGFTSLPKTPIGIRTADCLPILFWHKYERCTGGIHAGWKGLHCDIISATLEKLRGTNLALGDFSFLIGPCNGAETYETGPDVFTLFPEKFSAATGVPDKRMLKMREIAHNALIEKNVRAENIFHFADNVFGSAIWYSHRKGDAGRNIALISSA